MSGKNTVIEPDQLTLTTLKLNGQVVDLNYYFTSDFTDISQACDEIPVLIEWVNAQLQLMYEDKLNCANELKRVEAKAYFDLRGGSFQALYSGKMTDKALDYAIDLDEEVERLRKDYSRYAGWVQRLNNLQNSLQTRLDLIRSSEATRRRLVDAPELELERQARRKA